VEVQSDQGRFPTSGRVISAKPALAYRNRTALTKQEAAAQPITPKCAHAEFQRMAVACYNRQQGKRCVCVPRGKVEQWSVLACFTHDFYYGATCCQFYCTCLLLYSISSFSCCEIFTGTVSGT